MKVFHYPRCSTCRNALKWLDAHSVAYDAIDIVESPPSKALLKKALKLSGLPVNKLFNTSGQVYREGGYKDRLGNMSQDEALDALAANGKLIKRPLVLGEGFALVGFRQDAYSAQFE